MRPLEGTITVLSGEGWLVTPRRSAKSALKLFCCAYAGGNASVYRQWPAKMGDDIEVSAIQLPGRAGHSGRPPLTRVNQVIEELGPILLSVIDRPFAFFGHSLGSLVAFELSRWLRLAGRKPELLVVAGRRAPQLESNTEPFHLLGDSDLVERLRLLNGTPNEVLSSPELMKLVLPWLRSDFEMAETYRYLHADPLPCPILALGGSSDTETTHERLNAWKNQTSAAFAAKWFDGGHFFVQQCEENLIATITSKLAEPRASGRTASGPGGVAC